MNLATLRKLVLAYVAVVPILIVITALQFMSVKGLTEAYRREGKSFEMIREAEKLSTELAGADASHRAYLKTRKDAELAAYEAGPARTGVILARLSDLARDDREQEARVRALEAAVTERFDLYRQQLETQPLRGNAPAMRSAPPAPPNGAEVQGEAKSAEIAKLVRELRSHEFDRLPALAETSSEKLRRANRLGPVAGVVSVWMVLLATLLLYRDTARRAYAGAERRIQSRIVETLPLGVCVVDETGLVLYTNAAQDSLFGYEAGGMIGHSIASLRNPSRSEGSDVFDRAMDALRSEGSWRGDFIGRRKDMTTFHCVAQAVSMDLAGKPHRLFLMAGGPEPAAAGPTAS
jgi:PAS domain S-box-containing protein